MATVKHPYEMLVRWDRAGAISGAQIQYRYVITDDAGWFVTESVLPAEALTADSTFPVQDFLAKAQSDALAQAAAQKMQIDLLLNTLSDRDAENARLSAIIAAHEQKPA